MTIHLNGYSIRRIDNVNKATDLGAIFNLNNKAKLTIIGGTGNTRGTLIGGNNTTAGGTICMPNNTDEQKVKLINVIIDGSKAQTSASIWVHNKMSLEIDNCIFENCESSAHTGAVYIECEDTVNISNTKFINCKATTNSGAIIVKGGKANITNCSFENCKAGTSVGAIWNDRGTLTLTDSTITGCKANGTYAGAINNTGTLQLKNSSITGCSAGSYAGAIRNYGADAECTLINSDITNCSATTYAGAIFNSGTCTLTNGSDITNCSATTYAGAIQNTKTCTLTNSTISKCSAVRYGGAINNSSSGNLTIGDGTSITGCTTQNAGGGGAVVNRNSLTLKGKVEIKGNTSNNVKIAGIDTNNVADNLQTNNTKTIDASLLTDQSYIGIYYTPDMERSNLGEGRVINNLGSTTKDIARVSSYFHSDDPDYVKVTKNTNELHLLLHHHNWVYSVSGDTISALCTATVNPCANHTIPATAKVSMAQTSIPYGSTYDAAQAPVSDDWPTDIPVVQYTGTLSDGTAYSSAEKPTEVGEYQAKITVDRKTATVDFNITKADVSATAPTANTLTYNGSEQALISADSSSDSVGTVYYRVDGGDWDTTIPTAKNVKRDGTNVASYQVDYYVKGDANHNDKGSRENPAGSVNVTISPKTLTASMISLSLVDPKYTGSAQTQVVTVSDQIDNEELITSDDYEIDGDALTQTNVGEYHLTVQGVGNYTSDPIPMTWKIQHKDFAAGDIAAEDYSNSYDGQEHGITVSNPNKIAGFKVLYAESEDGPYSETPITKKDAADTPYTVWYKVTATGYNESAPASKTITIAKREITVKPDAGQSKVYGSSEPDTFTYQITSGALVDGESLLGAIGRDIGGEDAGEYAFTIGTLDRENANYEVSLAEDAPKFTITPKPVTLTWDSANLTYTGEKQTITARVSETVNDTDTFSFTYENNEAADVGTYTAVVTGLGNENYTLVGAKNPSHKWSISYLTAEAAVSGNKKTNEGNWYTGAVTIAPKESGYQISTDGRDWKDEIETTTEGAHTVTFYLKQTSTGSITDEMKESFTIDTTAPTGTITIKSNGVTRLFHTMTAGFFFKKTVDVTIAAEDAGGIAKVEYQKTAKGASYTPDGWVTGEQFSAEANEKFDVYARLTDEAGNETIIDSKGNVVYRDAVTEDAVTFTKASDEDLVTKIDVGVNTVKSVTMQKDGQALPEASYRVEDNKIVLSAEYLDTLTAGDYVIAVDYHPYGETFTAGEDAAPSTITVHVVKAAGTVVITGDLSKTFDGTKVSAPAYTKQSEADAVIEYKKKDADEDAFTTEAPSTAGTYIVRVTVPSDGTYDQAEVKKEFTIAKTEAKITVEEEKQSYVKTYGEETFSLEGVTKNGESDITYDSKDAAIAAVSETGTVTIKGAGETTITLTMAESENYKAVSETVTVKVLPKDITGAAVELDGTLTYTGKEQEQKVKSVVIDGLQATYDVTENHVTKAGDYVLKITGNGNYSGTIEQKFTVEKIPGTVSFEVNADAAAPHTEIGNSEQEMIAMLASEEELAAIEAGDSLKIWVEITDASATVSEASKNLIQSAASEYQVGAYIDISLYEKLATADHATQLTGTNQPITVRVTIPENLRTSDPKVKRSFMIVRVHEGKAEVLPTICENNTLTFMTDKFSDYAIMYQDQKVEEPVVEEPKPEDPAKDKPVVEEPKPEEPSKDQPAVEDPKKDQPAVEDPKKDKPAVEDPAKDKPAVEEPKPEEPSKDQPTVEDPKKDKPAVEDPKKDPGKSGSDSKSGSGKKKRGFSLLTNRKGNGSSGAGSTKVTSSTKAAGSTKAKAPRTGDVDLLQWWMLLLLGFVSMTGTAIYRRKSKKTK